ncbi:MAG: pyruvate carboxylase subunit B [Lachnospiraceae bacterium]|nr:pyruvate carboxylase subunit B [Lachnospiraceae bacterium]
MSNNNNEKNDNKAVAKKPVGITETILRDAHQSLIATRMPTEVMLPILDKLDKVGYHSIECWGGATFDASLRFLKEDPWERLRKIRDGLKNTKTQMLFRGQNILGYRPYADDVVYKFVEKSIANGIDIIRIFDCLNDLRNLQAAVDATNKIKKQEGRGHSQIALSYTLGDAYTLDYWASMAKKIEEMGADSICIKDMAGLLVPYKAEELVKTLKSATKLPIQLHTHYTSGVASMTYLKAVESGVDVIDCAMSPLALGTSQPATEVMVETFKGTPYDTGYDQKLLAEIADYFRPYREECLANGLLSPKVLGVNIKTLLYQVPGGMLSNMVSQLKEQHAEDKYNEVLEEIPRVRKDCGEPPLVTPSSQIVGTQAIFNVLMGERYKMATGEFKDLLRGNYGQTVKPMNEEVIKKVIPGEKRSTARSAEATGHDKPELEAIEKEMKQYKQQEEDVLSYALFPQVATDFFKYREAQQTKVDAAKADTENKAYPV